MAGEERNAVISRMYGVSFECLHCETRGRRVWYMKGKTAGNAASLSDVEVGLRREVRMRSRRLLPTQESESGVRSTCGDEARMERRTWGFLSR